MKHRSYPDAAGNPTVELVVVTVHGPQPNDELCTAAKTLAAAVARKLPKP